MIIVEYKSIWSKDISSNNVNNLTKDIKVDVLIIGGGMTGLSTAYYLRNSKLKVALVEQNLIGSGVSSRTTGKITYLQETIYTDLRNKYSIDIASKYFQSQQLAINEIKKIVFKENIKCNFDKATSYVFTDNKEDVRKLKQEKELLELMKVKVKEGRKLPNSLDCKYVVSVNNTYVFNCVKYMNGLKSICQKRRIKIFENTRVINVKKKDDWYVCYTDKYKITADKIVIACHYPFFLKPYMMPVKVYTEKSYLCAAKVDKYEKYSMINSTLPCKSLRYYRNGDKYLIYVSNSHNLCNDLNDKKCFDKLEKEVNSMNLEPEYMWSNDDMISVDRMPYIGRLEKDNDNLLIGTAYSTWGMTNSVLAGLILKDIITGKRNEYEYLFDPLRVNMANYLDEYVNNVGYNMKSFLENKVVKNKKWYSDKVRYEKRNGRDVAIYKDGDKEYIVYSNCPHFGCTLLFNEKEKTWDCPCHASKFDLTGKCIKGPSRFDITYNEDSEDDI